MFKQTGFFTEDVEMMKKSVIPWNVKGKVL